MSFKTEKIFYINDKNVNVIDEIKNINNTLDLDLEMTVFNFSKNRFEVFKLEEFYNFIQNNKVLPDLKFVNDIVVFKIDQNEYHIVFSCLLE